MVSKKEAALLCVLLMAVLNVDCSSKLNIPKVLLPLTRSTRINFTLETTDGCYRWSSTRPEVASIHPFDEDTDRGCSRRAVLQALSTQPTRLTSIILAEDVVTGQVLRCDAIVDIISEIKIASTTRELHLEDSPLELRIHALDSEGNTFSTLAGLVIDWALVKDVDGFSDSYTSLRVLKFSESTYTPPGYITEMERVGKQGDIILVSGMKTGHAKLKAKIQESLYKDVGSAEVRLLILENILLSPAHDVYLMAGTSMRYKVLKIRQGKMAELTMPCDQYELRLQNSVIQVDGNPDVAVASLDRSSSVVTAAQLGHINVVLDHKSLHMQGVSRLPNGTLYVVQPAYLTFRIHPGDSWVLQTAQQYKIAIEVFDKLGNKIYLSDNVRISAVFPGEFFKVLESSANGSYYHIKTLKPGLTVIDATLEAVVDETGKVFPLANPVHNEQDVEVYDPISLTPSILTFPWQPNVGAYQYTIQAHGGSGNFTWSSSNTAVATVTVKGVISTVSDIGMSVVYAHDLRNAQHFAQARVYVVEPVSIEIAPCKVETVVGGVLHLPIKIFGYLEREESNRVMLTDCSNFDLKVDADLKGVFELLPERLPPAYDYCVGVKIKSLTPGAVTLTMSYTHGNVHLSVKITVSGYRPFRAVDPVAVALVTLGSSKEMLFEGGPGPWVLEPSKFFSHYVPETPQDVSMAKINSQSHNHHHHFVRATCKNLGEQMLKVIVGNHPGLGNVFPATEEVLVKFICAPPARFVLAPMYTNPRLDISCPLLRENKQVVPVSNYRNALLDLTAYDQHGRKFDNFSSLSLQWETNNESLASLNPTYPMELHIVKDTLNQRLLHGRRTIFVHHRTGIAAISVNAQSYQAVHLAAAGVLSKPNDLDRVSATVELMLVEDVKVSPASITIYNFPAVRTHLTLKDGSGYFYVNTTTKGIANVVFQEAEGTAEVAPMSPGTVEVMVHDLCLANLEPAKATVHVSEIQEVIVRVIDKVEVGKTVNAYVRVLGANRKPFDADFYNYMDLRIKAATTIVTLRHITMSSENDTAVFQVTGLRVGQTTLSAYVTNKSGKKISSLPQDFEVFPQFKLVPRRMTLLIGAMMQITSEGGPQPESKILFSISNEDIAQVNHMGHVSGVSIGNVSVTGLVQAVDAETGNVVVVSQDRVEVEVVRLVAIRIKAPVTRIKSDSKMPVYVMGLTSKQTPFTFGSALPGLVFEWSTTKRDILDVQARHSEANVELLSQHNFGMMVTGRTRGRTGLKVVLKAVNPMAGQLIDDLPELMDEIQIQVYDTLHVLNPQVKADDILMAPNSVLKLKTNRDDADGLFYQILPYADQTAVAQVDDKGFLTSGPNTGISTLQITSQEIFGVNQTLILAVKVMPVSYLRFSASPVVHTVTQESQRAFPLGATLTFIIHSHASTGETLHSSNSHLRFSTNRDDLVQVAPGPRNHTLTIKTLNVGLTLLAVRDNENTGAADFIPLPVEHAIDPAEADRLVVGDVVCFNAPLVSQDGTQGMWRSTDNTVLQVDAKSGAAVARNSGVASLYYEVPGILKTYREVSVEAAKKTSAVAQPSPVRNGKDTRVLLSTREQGNNLIGTCSSVQTEAISALQPETLLDCALSFTDDAVDFPADSVLMKQTSFDSSLGLYVCSVTFQPMTDQQTRVLSTSMTNLLVKADLHRSTFAGDHVSARLPIEPGLYADQKELLLSSQHRSAELTVFGPPDALSDLQAVTSTPAITVEEKEVHHSVPYYSKFTVIGLDLEDVTLATVTIWSTSSGQSLVIPVTCTYEIQSFDYHLMFFMFFTLLACTAIVVIVTNSVLSQRQVYYNPSYLLKTPNQSVLNSPAGKPFNQPTTPSPGNNSKIRLFSTSY